MAKVLTDNQNYSDIADAIRAKLGVATTYYPSEMAAAVQSISGGGGSTLITKSITANGTYNASDDSADGYSQVTVAVPEKTLVAKSITANGTYDPADDSADGYSSVTVNVSSGGTLPSGYTRLSHVISDGNAYFNSQYESTADFGFHIQYYPTTSVSKNVFGGFSLDGTGLVYAINYGAILDTYRSLSDSPIQLSGLSTYRDVTITSNGTTIKAWKDYDTPTEISGHFDTNAVIAVGSFGDIINGVIVPRADQYQGSIKELRFFAGSEVVADFVPCIDPENVVGMYDIVRGRFFSSEGSSAFTAGNTM